MNCNECVYSEECKKPNADKPACLMLARYNRVYRGAKIPKLYQNRTIDDISLDDVGGNKAEMIQKYSTITVRAVGMGKSLYFYSEPTEGNPLGTGTGKTTIACALMNNYIRDYVWETVKDGQSIDKLPAYFLNCSTLQNSYNKMFRVDSASTEYYSMKQYAMDCNLLILDDIAIRGCSEGFMCELYDIIEHRVSNNKTTFYTSNVDLDQLSVLLDQRIASRICGSPETCALVLVYGEDHRVRG